MPKLARRIRGWVSDCCEQAAPSDRRLVRRHRQGRSTTLEAMLRASKTCPRRAAAHVKALIKCQVTSVPALRRLTAPLQSSWRHVRQQDRLGRLAIDTFHLMASLMSTCGAREGSLVRPDQYVGPGEALCRGRLLADFQAIGSR